MTAAIAAAAWYYAHVYRCSAQLDAAEDVFAHAAILLDPTPTASTWPGGANCGTHPWLMFGRPAVDAYAVTIDADLFRLGEATRRVERYDPAALPSRTRRAVYLIDTARAPSLRKNNLAVVHLLGNALREAADTVRYSTFARATALELAEHGGAVRADARQLAAAIGLAS
jgi:hypothetical protein